MYNEILLSYITKLCSLSVQFHTYSIKFHLIRLSVGPVTKEGGVGGHWGAFSTLLFNDIPSDFENTVYKDVSAVRFLKLD